MAENSSEITNLEGSLTNDKAIDVWLNHNELRWRVVLSTPIFSATVLVGWYTLRSSGAVFPSLGVLLVGTIAMLFYLNLIARLGDYAGAYYDAVRGKPKVPAPKLKLRAVTSANFLPVMIGAIFLILLVHDSIENHEKISMDIRSIFGWEE